MKFIFKCAIVLASSVLLFSSCHQRGCTDVKAVNYNVTADEDDGSCIVCDTMLSNLDSMTIYLKDKMPGSIHYNQNVARFFLDQNIFTPSDKACGKEYSPVNLYIESLVNEKMYINYRISTVDGPIYIYYSADAYIETFETFNAGEILKYNNPPFFNIGLDSLNVTAYDLIYY